MVCVEISECDIKFLNVMKLHILFSVTYGLELHVSIFFYCLCNFFYQV